jgi:hypothetical protein
MKNKITRNEIKRCFLFYTYKSTVYVTYIAPLYEAIKPDTQAIAQLRQIHNASWGQVCGNTSILSSTELAILFILCRH